MGVRDDNPFDFWCETVAVDPNTYYEISAWFSTCFDTLGFSATIQFIINSSPIGGFVVPKIPGKWARYSNIWYSGSSTTANFCMKDTGFGRHFAVDDISINAVCTANDSVYVAMSHIDVIAGPDTSICNAGPVTLHATGATSYTWSPAVSLSCATCANPVATVAATTKYIIAGATGGCTDTDTITIAVDTIAIHISAPPKICTGEAANITASGAIKYRWTPATGLSCNSCADPVVTINTSTQYFVTGYDAANCPATDSITIAVVPLPAISATQDPNTRCQYNNMKLIATGGSSYYWSPGQYLDDSTSSHPTLHNISSLVTLHLTGIDTNGCKNSDTIIALQGKEAIVAMPSAFSPNGDGINDVFYIRGVGVATIDCNIYNRWGQKIFETTNMNTGWDGTYNGAKQPVETYACIVRVTTIDGCETIKKGSVILLK